MAALEAADAGRTLNGKQKGLERMPQSTDRCGAGGERGLFDEVQYVVDLLGGNKKQAAWLLGIHESALEQLLRENRPTSA